MMVSDFIIAALIGYTVSDISKTLLHKDLPDIRFYLISFIFPLTLFLLEVLNHQFFGYYKIPNFTNKFPDVFTQNISLKIFGLIVGSMIDKLIEKY